MSAQSITLKDIQKTAKRIKPYIYRTPSIYAHALSEYYGARIYLKLENLQLTGAFKIRGNANKLSLLSDEELAGGVVTASSGNHGLGLSLSAKRRSVRATVMVPERTPQVKLTKLKKYGAQLRIEGNSYDDAVYKAMEFAEETGAIYIPSFDDWDIIAGNTTLGLEILEDVPDLKLVVAPIGGGGCISGISLALNVFSSKARVKGVEAEEASSMYASLQAGKPTVVKNGYTLADGIAVKKPGHITYKLVKRYVDDIILVADDEMKEALKLLLYSAKVLPEMAGAASLAALEKIDLPSEGSTVIVVSGGNIDEKMLIEILRN